MKKVLWTLLVPLAVCLSCSEDKEVIPDPDPVPPMEEPEPEPIVWKDYIYSDIVKDSVWPDGKGETFVVKGVSASAYLLRDCEADLLNGIHPGMVLRVDTNGVPAMQVVRDVKYNPFVYSSFIGGKAYVEETDNPSENLCLKMRDDILANTSQINSFSYSSGKAYRSAKELYMLYACRGIRVDSLLNGAGYQVCEMKKKNGIVYTYEYEAFSLDMDIPQFLLKEEPSNPASLVYICNLTFGLRGFLTVESDSAAASIKSVIEKIKNKKELTKAEVTLLDKADMRTAHVCSGKGGSFREVLNVGPEAANSLILKFFDISIDKSSVGVLNFNCASYLENSLIHPLIRIDVPADKE